jgi:hypothetical protein
MRLTEALVLDRQGRIQEAAAAYETVLQEAPDHLEGMLNLLVLYWQATDYGTSAAARLSPEFVDLAGRRLRELLASAHKRFPGRPEVVFWAKYIAWADFGDPFELAECRELLRAHPSYLEPALLLYSMSAGAEAEPEAMQLLERCSNEQTARCRYIVSVLDGVLKRRRTG